MIKLELLDGRPSVAGTDGPLRREGIGGGGALTRVSRLGTGTRIFGSDGGLSARLGGGLGERGALRTRHSVGGGG